MDYGILFYTLALLFGFYMAWNIGANDVANAMGTSVGSKALSLLQAVILAAALEFSGAFLAGDAVSETLQKKILPPETLSLPPEMFILGMLSALLATGILLQIASYFGLPVSTTHAIVGAVTGFGALVGGMSAVSWSTVGKIALSWVLSPLFSGLAAYFLFSFAKQFVRRLAAPQGNVTVGQEGTEKIFTFLQIGSASLVAFAHGANDVANAIGPVAAILATLKKGAPPLEAAVPTWLLALGGGGIVLGLATWGWRVIETVGKKITELTPMRGFAAEFGAASVIFLASRWGLPVSTTHALVGALIGVGLAQGTKALNLFVIWEIVISWIVTIPLCAGGCVAIFYVLKWLLY